MEFDHQSERSDAGFFAGYEMGVVVVNGNVEFSHGFVFQRELVGVVNDVVQNASARVGSLRYSCQVSTGN